MKYIERRISPRLEKAAQNFPAIAILGPRQSGKTTIAKALFPEHKYVNLEALDLRERATEDPRQFINSLKEERGVILDEIQRVPELLSYIQVYIDEWKKAGFFILTGSENILLSHHINQTLAGRIAITTLLPLSIEELREAKALPTDYKELLYRGFYPPLHNNHSDPEEWIESYLGTYIERDLRQLRQIQDLSLFQKFLKLCAGRIGQLLDLTAIGNDCGIATNTVKSWLSLLEATYVVFLLQPHHKNFNKRLVKSPKLYFYDCGLASHLLSIRSLKDLETHYLRGGLFESLILADLMKRRFNTGKRPNLYFWRDRTGHEVDCIIDNGEQLIPVEIKSGETVNSGFFSNLAKWNELSGGKPENSYLVYGGLESQKRSHGTVLSWDDLSQLPI